MVPHQTGDLRPAAGKQEADVARIPKEFAFDVQEHVLRHYGPIIGLVPDDDQHYPDRIVGSDPNTGRRVVVIPKGVGFDNADRFRHWVAVDPTHWASMTARPEGWDTFILMIGLLPDGQPWWSALYDERRLAQDRIHSEQMWGFYRFDPGITKNALVGFWDKDRPETNVDSPAVYRATLGDVEIETPDQADFMASIWDFAASIPDKEPITGRIDVAGNEMSVHID